MELGPVTTLSFRVQVRKKRHFNSIKRMFISPVFFLRGYKVTCPWKMITWEACVRRDVNINSELNFSTKVL